MPMGVAIRLKDSKYIYEKSHKGTPGEVVSPWSLQEQRKGQARCNDPVCGCLRLFSVQVGIGVSSENEKQIYNEIPWQRGLEVPGVVFGV